MSYFRDLRHPNYGVTQATDGDGPPFLDDSRAKTEDGKTVQSANQFRLEVAERLHPTVIVITWMINGHNAMSSKEGSLRSLNRTIDRIQRSSPRSKVVVVGPFPYWSGSLRSQLIRYYQAHHTEPPVYMNYGARHTEQEWDDYFKMSIKRQGVVYISALEHMCTANGCLTRLSDNVLDLASVDWGHLTRTGSIYLIGRIESAIFD